MESPNNERSVESSRGLSSGRTWLLAMVLLGARVVAAEEATDPRITPLVRMIQQVRPAVVAVFSQGPQQQIVSGSGAIIHPDGYILTNDHVVQDRPGVVLVEGRRPMPYQLVGRLPESDLAIVKVEPVGQLTAMPLGRSHDLLMGEPIVNIGNPGGRGIVATAGIVSAPALRLGNALAMSYFPHDELDRVIQFDAASNPGNSGGPLINALGQVVGVVQGMVQPEENTNLAIPIDSLRKYLPTLLAAELRGGYVSGLTVNGLASQAVVAEVVADSPADRAGFRKGDVIVKLDQQELETPSDWYLASTRFKPEQTLRIHYLRNDSTNETDLVLSVRQPQPALSAELASQLKPELSCRAYFSDATNVAPFSRERAAEPSQVLSVPLPVAKPEGLNQEDFYELVYEGHLQVPSTGLYRLSTGSDDGSRLYLHDELLVDNNGHHPVQFRGQWCYLAAGWHPFRLEFFEYSGDQGLLLRIQSQGSEPRDVVATDLHGPVAAGESDARP